MTEGKVDVKFGEWIQQGWELYKANIGVWIVASLLAIVISVATLGILSGPMMAGLAWMALVLVDRKEPKPQMGDVFKGFDYFLQSFLFFLVWGVIMMAISAISLIPCIGPLVVIVVSIALHTALMFGVFLIVDKKMEFWPASMLSLNVVKPNFFPFLGLLVVAMLIGHVGAIACGIGVIVTMPIAVCILAVAYRNVFGVQAAA
ncbi:MAG: hypothetical protein KKC28_05525 [Verrucomicrobia bacterium]|nr:hypothetical protein [Verrucomicrobiota bacterium]MBU1856425.1 hypothetical protein [Verrucomicrobiota bacterium]